MHTAPCIMTDSSGLLISMTDKTHHALELVAGPRDAALGLCDGRHLVDLGMGKGRGRG